MIRTGVTEVVGLCMPAYITLLAESPPRRKLVVYRRTRLDYQGYINVYTATMVAEKYPQRLCRISIFCRVVT